ncbi:nitrate- and nitrite sensing domain-containing protein [Streptomyces sp. NPDC056707]|uniref:sensor histidine kinase n=1 Tax=Streptomyces sp. NPDC056707 TaxID=3345919 RepID=UPI00368DB2F6
MLPLCMVLLLTVPFVADRLKIVRQADSSAEQVDTALLIGEVLHELDRERTLATAYLLTPKSPSAPLIEQAQAVSDQVAQLNQFFDGRAPAKLATAITRLGELSPLREEVRLRHSTPDRVSEAFDQAIQALIDGLELSFGRASGRSGDHQYDAVAALLRANAASSRAAALTMRLLLDPDPDAEVSERITVEIRTAVQMQRREANSFRRHAEPMQAKLYKLVDSGHAAAHVAALRTELDARLGSARTETQTSLSASRVYSEVETDAMVRHLFEERIGQQISHHTRSEASSARAAAIVFAALAVLLFLGTVILSVAIGRSIARPLGRLTGAAAQVADLARMELVRVADDDVDEQGAPQLAAIVVDSQDEIGELAHAVNRVQAAAALLLERQVSSRRNIATMFGNLGRRTQNLVSRQLALIDVLESEEQDSERLERLYRLDHLSARLRRHADSLLVLSGWIEQTVTSKPLTVADAVRTALGGIEEFRRVRLLDVDEALLAPEATGDILLVIAELLENATAFSPPASGVEISARQVDGACYLDIVDHGVGMSAERMAEANSRMMSRERLDLTPTDVLGLFVVGRLCRRHGLQIELTPTPGGGVTAQVRLPAALLVGEDGKASQPPGDSAFRPQRTSMENRALVSGGGKPDDARGGTSADQYQAPTAAGAGGGQSARQLTVVGGREEAGGDLRDGLVRRRPGAQLPASDHLVAAPGPRPPGPAAGQEDATDDLVADFEAGAQRALSEQHLSDPEPEDDACGSAPAVQLRSEAAWKREGLERMTHAVSRQAEDAKLSHFGWFDSGSRKPVVAQTSVYDMAPPPGLPRRVPGAQLSAPARPAFETRPAAALDPEAIRSAIEDFEAGVARAQSAHPEVTADRPEQP